jgi:hypothetical protein
MSEPSGHTSREPFAYFDRESSVWRTCQPSLFQSLDESPIAWGRSGMTSGGHAYALPTSGRHIAANGYSSLLPTPIAGDRLGTRNATSSRQPGSQHHSGTTLTDVLWQMAGITDASTTSTSNGHLVDMMPSWHANEEWPL